MAKKKEEVSPYVARIADYQQIFSSDTGKKVLWDLMKKHGLLTTTMVLKDPYESAFREGQRAVVLEILKKMKTDIKKLHDMMMSDKGEESDYV